jgi:hypothetical protein
MRIRTVGTLLLLPLVASLACAPGEQAQQEEEAGMEAAGGEMEAGSEMMMGEMATITLSALNNSGITGTAEIAHSDDAMTVVLNMSGLTAGESYAAHIHEGTCEEQGSAVATLSPVVGAADGSGTRTTEIAKSEMMGEMGEEGMMGEEPAMGEMAEGAPPPVQRYVQLHLPSGAPAACANIEPPSEGMM